MYQAVIKENLSPADQGILALLNNKHRSFTPGKKVYLYLETFEKKDQIIGAYPEDGTTGGEIAPLPLSFLETSGKTKTILDQMLKE